VKALDRWREVWPRALALWSPYARLRDPIWCTTTSEARAQALTHSMAGIRLADHQVVIDMALVTWLKLDGFAMEILAHEVGHHIYCPADLADSGRMLARIRRAMPTKEAQAPLVSNLFSDLLINDRLQRAHGLKMDDVYRALRTADGDRSAVWQLYMGIYEYLWSLPPGSLTQGRLKPEIAADASLGARLVRAYQRDWLTGAARFASLLFPYFVQDPDDPVGKAFGRLADAAGGVGSPGGEGGEVPGGLASEEDGEDDTLHPSEDPRVAGEKQGQGDRDGDERGEGAGGGGHGPGTAKTSDGRKKDAGVRPRSLVAYGDLLRELGVKVDAKELAIKYYRELASRFLVRFPEIPADPNKELTLEGHDVWDVGAPLENIDWIQTVMASPRIVPGYTTRERVYGESTGREIGKSPPDIYIGIDCSGSMPDPRAHLSYPVLAGVVLACSALRVGARVMACLSGESGGKTIATAGFRRNEREVLELLTDYLGTGYSFGIHYLKPHLIDERRLRPTHVLIVSDSDIFSILNETPKSGAGAGVQGWEIARQAAERAGAGATFVLNIAGYERTEVKRMESIGWKVHIVQSMDQVLAFATALSRELYEAVQRRRRR
jgi:hypothetical protein